VRKNSVTFAAALAMTAAAAFWLTSAAQAGSKGSGRPSTREILVTKKQDVSSSNLMRKAGGGQKSNPNVNYNFGKTR
jgi:hypothetical protein